MRAASLGLWLLFGALWLANLPLRPLFDPDEGRYAEIPREMAASGDWVTPTLNELKYLEKPPLQYWATAVLYSAFGVHEWTARLWATALAFLCIPLVFAFCRRIGYSTDTSLVAAALLAINPYFAITGQLNLLDQGFTFFLSVAVFAFAIAQQEHGRSRHWMLITWSALALAVLSKGIVTLILATATLVAHVAITRDLAPLRRLQPVLGLVVFLVITVPWFWLVQSQNPDFFQFFFVREHFERFLTTMHDRVEPFWYFVPIVLIALLPVIGNWRTWSLAKVAAERTPRAFRVELFLLIWCVVVVALFSASQSKLASYVMPIMPPLAVLLARVTHAERSALPRAKWISICFLVLVAIGLVIAGWRRSGLISVPATGYAGAVVLVCSGYLFFDRIRTQRNLSQRWCALAAVSIACYQILALCYATAFPARSAEGLAAGVASCIRPDTKLYSVGQYRHSLSFYLQRPVAVYDFLGELEFGLRQAGVTVPDQDLGKFLAHWQKETNAIAFIDRRVYGELHAAQMPGRIVAGDARSIVMARS